MTGKNGSRTGKEKHSFFSLVNGACQMRFRCANVNKPCCKPVPKDKPFVECSYYANGDIKKVENKSTYIKCPKCGKKALPYPRCDRCKSDVAVIDHVDSFWCVNCQHTIKKDGRRVYVCK